MKWNHGFRRHVLPLSAAAMLLGLVATGNAQANVIAVSIDTISNFTLSSTGPGSVFESNPNSTASTSASFNALTSGFSATCPGLGPCNPGGLSANPLQATAGPPGPFPAQDTYTQPPAGGFVGSRGDANVNSISFNLGGAAAQNVAETRLNAGSTGGANGTNQISTTIQIEVAGTQQITFAFTADPYLQVGVDQAGESAVANLAVAISLSSGGGLSFRWMPDSLASNDFGVDSQVNPFSLNQNLNINSPAGNQTINPGPGNFSATSVGLGPGTYTLTINLSETVRGVQAEATVVPEPSALLLLALGLALLAWTGARRVRKKKD